MSKGVCLRVFVVQMKVGGVALMSEEGAFVWMCNCARAVTAQSSRASSRDRDARGPDNMIVLSRYRFDLIVASCSRQLF